jgi:hypothetical protein
VIDVVFQQTDEIYRSCNGHRITIHNCEHALVGRFVIQLRGLESSLGELADDPYWNSILRPLRRYRYNIASVPLALNHPDIIPANLFEALGHGMQTCRQVYPAFGDSLSTIAQLVDELSECRDSPLLDGTQDSLNAVRSPKSALVLRSSINISVRKKVRALLKEYDIEILTYSSLLSLNVFESLVYIGPFGWFPDSARSSPRCSRLASVKFGWMADGSSLSPSFVCTADSNLLSPRQVTKYFGSPSQSGQVLIRPDEAAPPVNWSAVGAEIERQSDFAETQQELAGQLLMLNGSVALIVDAASGAKVHIIQPSGSTRLRKILVEDLELGMYILVRTEGGGDLVAEIADAILMDRAAGARALQDNWKRCLAEHVHSRGEDSVLSDLEGLGCKRATQYNLRNWISSKSIRPEYDDDFLSVLILCGLGNEEALIANANLLDRVHRSAGFRIRRMLLAMAALADLKPLVREGVMEFQLPGARGGGFTAYRIDAIAPKVQSVPADMIGQIYNVDRANG